MVKKEEKQDNPILVYTKQITDFFDKKNLNLNACIRNKENIIYFYQQMHKNTIIDLNISLYFYLHRGNLKTGFLQYQSYLQSKSVYEEDFLQDFYDYLKDKLPTISAEDMGKNIYDPRNYMIKSFMKKKYLIRPRKEVINKLNIKFQKYNECVLD